MSKASLNIRQVEETFEHMIHVMERSKRDIFEMSEEGRKQYQVIQRELRQLKKDIAQLIEESDQLERDTQNWRQHLAKVSQKFDVYSEEEVRKTYETANDLLIQLSIKRAEEKQMRQRRDDLERQLIMLLQSVERADQLVNQVSTVLTYLTTDLKHIGETFQDAQQKQRLAIRVIQAQEEERKRLSREIHDGPAQLMANVSLRAGYIEQIHAKDPTFNLAKELKELKELTRDALKEVRHIIFDLRPMALDDLGLVPTLEKYLSKTQKHYQKTEIHYTNFGKPSRLESNYEAALFRLVQESVANALKHANATDIWVKTEWVHDKVNVVVKDNGVGFQQSDIGNQSFGITGMKERVQLLKGELSIRSLPNEGTTILIQIPLKKIRTDEIDNKAGGREV